VRREGWMFAWDGRQSAVRRPRSSVRSASRINGCA